LTTLSKYNELVKRLKEASASLQARIEQLENAYAESTTMLTSSQQSLASLNSSVRSLRERLEQQQVQLQSAQTALRRERWRWLLAVLLALLTGGGIGAIVS
jgi:septal ring factor EnvC (AmiA/AmiB activator)